MLRAASDCDVQDHSEFIVGFLESVFSDVISEKLLKDFDIESTSLFTGSSQFVEKGEPFLICKSREVEGALVEEFLPRVGGYH